MTCDKKTFLTKKEADKRIDEIKSIKDEITKKPVRSYKCEICENYHLTSWTKKRKKQIENKPKIIQNNRIEALAQYWIKRKGW